MKRFFPNEKLMEERQNVDTKIMQLNKSVTPGKDK